MAEKLLAFRKQFVSTKTYRPGFQCFKYLQNWHYYLELYLRALIDWQHNLFRITWSFSLQYSTKDLSKILIPGYFRWSFIEDRLAHSRLPKKSWPKRLNLPVALMTKNPGLSLILSNRICLTDFFSTKNYFQSEENWNILCTISLCQHFTNSILIL